MIIISIHIFPHELKRFQRIVETFEKSLVYIEDYSNIRLTATLNNNNDLIEWGNENSVTFIDKFCDICKNSTLDVNTQIKNEENFLGVNEHRRITINESDISDTIIFLDSDLYFDERLLAHQINSINLVSDLHEYYIITPQIIKLWDTSWDCIVNQNYITKPHDYYKTANASEISNAHYGPVGLTSSTTFKWGGGWFNAISASLLKYTGIPNTFIGYGPDDTFVMECCKLMKKHNKDVQQYILSNMVVVEDRTTIKSEVKLKKSIPNFREECDKHFLSELSIFAKKL